MKTTHGPAHVRLGKAIRVLRVERELSQETLGERGGLHRNYVGAIERGEINPTYRVLLKIGRGLDTVPSEVLARAEALERAAGTPRRD
jgi:transcriptional regulator with XRE-family HTH domain